MSISEKFKKAKEIIKAAGFRDVIIEDMIYCKRGGLLVIVSYYDSKRDTRLTGSLVI